MTTQQCVCIIDTETVNPFPHPAGGFCQIAILSSLDEEVKETYVNPSMFIHFYVMYFVNILLVDNVMPIITQGTMERKYRAGKLVAIHKM